MINYGQSGYKIGSDNILSISLTSCSLTSEVLTSGSMGTWTFSMQNVGCGSTGFNIILDDSTIPFQWSKISWKTYFNFKSSCWSFGNGGYGTGTHNILSWNTSLGDMILRPKNCFELSQYAIKMNACDNNSDNFAHSSYATGSFRQWSMIRRRDAQLSAGPSAGFACTGGGTCIISEIIVWR